MKIIGIVTRKSTSTENHEISVVYNEVVKKLKKYNIIPIGIILEEDYKDIINICDGIVFQGGDDIEAYDLLALKYIYDNNIPVLGICLGMQEMGVLFNGNMIDIDNHKKDNSYRHTVKIKRNTKLYSILKKDIIEVNSRHRSIIDKTDLTVSGISNDGYIEALEDSNKKFFIGVQWHPESMNDDRLFKSFIDSID